jgi:hypothetical protein
MLSFASPDAREDDTNKKIKALNSDFPTSERDQRKEDKGLQR